MASGERSDQIIRLLQTRDDGLPTPTHRDDATTRGFVHRSKAAVSCPDCLANDKVMFGCETCKGRGTVDEWRETDPYAVTEKVQPYGLDPQRHEKTRERDAQIDRLAHQTKEPWKSTADELAEANARPYAWEIARKKMYSEFDYGLLDRALEAMRNVDEPAYSILHSAYVYGWVEPSASFEAVVQRGLAFIDARMPDPIRAPAADSSAKVAGGAVGRGAGAKTLELRDDRIRSLAAEGLSPEEIATACGISVRTVYRAASREAA